MFFRWVFILDRVFGRRSRGVRSFYFNRVGWFFNLVILIRRFRICFFLDFFRGWCFYSFLLGCWSFCFFWCNILFRIWRTCFFFSDFCSILYVCRYCSSFYGFCFERSFFYVLRFDKFILWIFGGARDFR